jgi:hypothetical protein
MNSKKRLPESIYFLKRIIGINETDISVLKLNWPLLDSEIYKYIKEIYEELCVNFKDIDEIITTAYEGGHQDHDAASVVGRALANKLGISLSEFFLYNGHRTFRKLYRVSSPFHCINEKKIKYTLQDLIHLVKSPFIYRTQWSTMLGLWPFLFMKAFFSPLVLRILSGDALKIPTIKEVPMYERWDRITYNDFNQALKRGVEDKSIAYLCNE